MLSKILAMGSLARLVSLRGNFRDGQFDLAEPPPQDADGVEVIVTFMLPGTEEA